MIPPADTLAQPAWLVLPILLFPLFWFGIAALLSYLAGWPALAARFRSFQVPVGQRFRFASGAMGASRRMPVSYRNCLNFVIGDAGLHLSIFVLFRFLAPPLFIPWTEVESVSEERLWLAQHVVVRVRGFSTRILLRGKPGECVLAAYAGFLSRRRK